MDFQFLLMTMNHSAQKPIANPSMPKVTAETNDVLLEGKNSMAKMYPTKTRIGIAKPSIKIKTYVNCLDVEKRSTVYVTAAIAKPQRHTFRLPI